MRLEDVAQRRSDLLDALFQSQATRHQWRATIVRQCTPHGQAVGPQHTRMLVVAGFQAALNLPEFMMKEVLGLEEPDPKRALRSALTIGLAYIAGGIIPLTPYALNLTLNRALLLSVVLTLIALFVFGALKGRFTGSSVLKSTVHTELS